MKAYFIGLSYHGVAIIRLPYQTKERGKPVATTQPTPNP